MTEYDNCSKSKAKTMLENKIWAQNSNFWNLNIYPQISVFLLSPSHCYQDRKMKTRGWSPTEFVWRLYQHFLLKMAPMTKELQCFHIKWTHCSLQCMAKRLEYVKPSSFSWNEELLRGQHYSNVYYCLTTNKSAKAAFYNFCKKIIDRSRLLNRQFSKGLRTAGNPF